MVGKLEVPEPTPAINREHLKRHAKGMEYMIDAMVELQQQNKSMKRKIDGYCKEVEKLRQLVTGNYK